MWQEREKEMVNFFFWTTTTTTTHSNHAVTRWRLLTGYHVWFLRVDEVRRCGRRAGRCESGRGRCRSDRRSGRSRRRGRQSGSRGGQLLLLLQVELLLLLLLDELQLLRRYRGRRGRICCRCSGRCRRLLCLMITEQLLNEKTNE